MRKTYQTSVKVKRHLREVIGFLAISAIILVIAISYQDIVKFRASYETLIKMNEVQTESIRRLEMEVSDLHIELDGLCEKCNEMSETISKLSSEIEGEEISKQFDEDPKHEELISWVKDICQDYRNVDPAVVLAVIEAESSFDPNASNGTNFGLMQIDPKWHSKRAKRLGVTDWFDPVGSIRLGVDYLSEIDNEIYKVRGLRDLRLTLMVYNMGYARANKLYDSGDISDYASFIVASSESWRQDL